MSLDADLIVDRQASDFRRLLTGEEARSFSFATFKAQFKVLAEERDAARKIKNSAIDRLDDTMNDVLRLSKRVDAAEARAAEMLQDVRIPDGEAALRAYPHEFSGGMRQRAMIAMALANEPKLLIADEPTTALDVTTQAQIVALIKDLQRDFGAAVVWISHDLGLVGSYSDSSSGSAAGIQQAPARAARYGQPRCRRPPGRRIRLAAAHPQHGPRRR